MHADMTAVTTQSNKIVSNEVKDNQALLQPAYGRKKKKPIFLANPIYFREAAYVKFRNLNPNSISDTVQLSKSKPLNKIQFFSHKTQV